MPELVYPLVARAESHDALGDSAAAKADRELAALSAGIRGSCAYCLDPFRY